MELVKDYTFIVLDFLFSLWGVIFLFFGISLIHFYLSAISSKRWSKFKYDELAFKLNNTNDLSKAISIRRDANFLGYDDIVEEANLKIKSLYGSIDNLFLEGIDEVPSLEVIVEAPSLRKIRVNRNEVEDDKGN